MGERGYLEAAKRIMDTATYIRREIENIPELKVLGDPTFLIAFASDTLNIYQVLEYMTHKGWGLNGLHLPPSVHICITLRHTEPGVQERLIRDLKEAVTHIKANPKSAEGIGPIYGMASMPGMEGFVTQILNWYLDTQFKV
jgi:glutamate/tyrosine decarboxylase-like PLP-dependent enzyme